MNQLAKPCGECPFKRTSLPGWIGGHEDPSEITNIVMADRKFPCHIEANRLENEGESFDEAMEEAPYCSGSLILMNNSCKRSRHRNVATMQQDLGRSPDIFKNASEFIDHHDVHNDSGRRNRP